MRSHARPAGEIQQPDRRVPLAFPRGQVHPFPAGAHLLGPLQGRALPVVGFVDLVFAAERVSVEVRPLCGRVWKGLAYLQYSLFISLTDFWAAMV